MIDLRQLWHATVVAEHRSFAQAARAIHLSQPALSRSVQALESALGVVLFERGSRGIEPTDEGRLLLRRASALLAGVEDLERESGTLARGDAGQLRIACGPYAAELVVGPTVARMVARHPRLQFRLRVDHWVSALEMVRNREVDLAVCEQSEARDSVFEVFQMGSRPGCLVVRAAHPLAGKRRLATGDVMAYPLALAAKVPARILQQVLAETGKSTIVAAVECDNLAVLKTIVAESDAVSCFPLCLVEEELRTGQFCVLDCEVDWLRVNYALVRLRDRVHSSAAEQFLEGVLGADAECSRKEEELRGRYLGRHPVPTGPSRRQPSKKTREK